MNFILFRGKKQNKVVRITIIELHFNNFVSSIACETWRPGVQVKKHGINGCFAFTESGGRNDFIRETPDLNKPALKKTTTQSLNSFAVFVCMLKDVFSQISAWGDFCFLFALKFVRSFITSSLVFCLSCWEEVKFGNVDFVVVCFGSLSQG